MVDKTAYKRTIKNFVFELDKHFDAFVFQFPDNTGTQVYHLLVGISDVLIVDTPKDFLSVVFIKER